MNLSCLLNFYQLLSIDGVNEGGNENLNILNKDRFINKIYRNKLFWFFAVVFIFLFFRSIS